MAKKDRQLNENMTITGAVVNFASMVNNGIVKKR